jgi:CRISPR-associated protein Cmr1
MMTIPLTLTFLTPAFIGGADKTGKAEFRLPSLKGVLRYWWRQFQDQNDSQALFDKESRIFGSTKGQSRVILRQIGDSPELSPGNRAFDDEDERNGIKYLLYSCYELSQNQPGRLQWILPGQSVTFEMRLVGTSTDNQEVLLVLYFAQSFGGLGYRSRRGAGSFQLKVDPAPMPTDPLAPFAGLLSTKVQEFIAAYSWHAITPYGWAPLIHAKSPLATAFAHPNYFKEVSPPGTTTGGDVLDHIGKKMKGYRSVREYQTPPPNTFHQEACALHKAGGTVPPSYPSAAPNPITKAAFGLPIIYRFSSRDAAGIPVGHERWWIEASPVTHERRASPLHISVKQDATNSPYANLLVLWSEFLPSREQVALTKKERGIPPTAIGTVNQPTDAVVTTFLGQFP